MTSFSFGFDPEDEEMGTGSSIGASADAAPQVAENPIDVASREVTVPPKVCPVRELLDGLVGTRITYEGVDTGGKSDGIQIYRRSFYDIKQQLMAEDKLDNGVQEDADLFKILVGEKQEDLRKGVYEGGLKSWECSYDLVGKLATLGIEAPFNVIELGCGTALPSLYEFIRLLLLGDSRGTGRSHVVLSDYNYDVLRLVTFPNVLINWYKYAPVSREALLATQQGEKLEEAERDQHFLVSEQLCELFLSWLETDQCSSPISLSFISGAWSREFMELVHEEVPNLRSAQNLVLTSETIYSPDAVQLVGQMVLDLTFSQRPYTIVAAKDFYFGVGGSVTQLTDYLAKYRDEYEWEVEKVSHGVQRSLVSIAKR